MNNVLFVSFRYKTGKQANKKLRINNQLPAIIHIKKKIPILITLSDQQINNSKYTQQKYYNKELLIIISNEKKIKVKIQEIQKHPFKTKITHIDFIKI